MRMRVRVRAEKREVRTKHAKRRKTETHLRSAIAQRLDAHMLQAYTHKWKRCKDSAQSARLEDIGDIPASPPLLSSHATSFHSATLKICPPISQLAACSSVDELAMKREKLEVRC